MSDKTNNEVIIIGGGIGGLALGCYLQMNGYSTSIFEKNADCGGVTVSWKRGDYTFDGATNWLAGSSPAANMHYMLRELIDFKELEIIDPDEFITVEHAFSTLHVYTSATRLEEEMLRIAPEDKDTIQLFTEAIKKIGTFTLPYELAPELFTFFDYAGMIFTQLPFLLFFSKWRRVTIDSFSKKFKNTTLRKLFLNIFPHHHHFSVFSIMMTLGWMNVKSGGYPVGGSKKFIDLIEKRYRDLNGKLYANMPVKKININNNTATGVITSDNLEHAARLVISASDLQHTLKDLLNQPALTSKQIEKTAHFPVFPSLLQISLGLKRQFSGIPHKIQMPLIEKITLGDSLVLEDMMVRICSFDQTLAPPGCTSIAVHFRTPDYEFWTDLRKNNRKEYQLLKKKIADAVIDTLDKRFGNIRETVEEIDVATPATYIRYTNIYKGSYQGWAPVPGLIGKTLPKQIKQLKNFYFSGQWVWPAGGLPGVIRIGRQTAQIICRRDGKKFTVSGSKV